MTQRTKRLAAALLVSAVAVLAAGRMAASDDDGRIVYEIPPGSVARAEAGEDLRIIPDTVTVDLTAADTVEVRNNDDRPFQFASTVIGPGQSYVARFEEPGVYLFMCSLRGGKNIRFVVLGEDGTIGGTPVPADGP